jgi:hypothetical protein
MANFVIGGNWNYTGTMQFSNYTTGYAYFDASGNFSSVAAPATGLIWLNVAGTSQAMVANHGYFPNNAGTTTFILPPTSSVGDTFAIAGSGNCQWIIAENSGQYIQLGNKVTTTSSGTLSSTDVNDGVTIVCQIANTKFYVQSPIGELDLT